MSKPSADIQKNLKIISKNVAITFFRQLASMLLGLLLMILLARSLGPEGNGKYSVAMLLPTLLVSFANIGIPSANVYYLGAGNYTCHTVYRMNIKLWLILSVTGISLALPAAFYYGEKLFKGVDNSLLLLSLCAFPVMLLQAFIISILQGKEDFVAFNRLSLQVSIANIIFVLVLVYCLGRGVSGAIWAYIMAYTLNLLSAIKLITHYQKTEDQKNNCSVLQKQYQRHCLAYGFKAYLSNLVTFFNYRLNIYLVNWFLNPAATGIYVIAVQIAEKLWILSQAVSTVLLPRLAGLGENEEVRRYITPLLARIIFYMTIAICAIIAILAKPVIATFFGTRFLPAVMALFWLLPGTFVFG